MWRSCWAALATTVKVAGAGHRQTNEHGEIVKTQVWLLLLRGDHDMNENQGLQGAGLERASVSRPWPRLKTTLVAKPGYLAPSVLQSP